MKKRTFKIRYLGKKVGRSEQIATLWLTPQDIEKLSPPLKSRFSLLIGPQIGFRGERCSDSSSVHTNYKKEPSFKNFSFIDHFNLNFDPITGTHTSLVFGCCITPYLI
jgi:hypothetical protein